MPFWGRPPGAGPGRKTNKGWGKRRWEGERRVEEISDSDDDDEQGVELEFGSRAFSSDELHFTGFDMGSGVRRRRTKYDSDDELEGSEEDMPEHVVIQGAETMQLMLREKEDYLVERALERIRRAQMLGKTNVKLSRQEMDALDALDRKTKLTAGPRPRGKKSSSSKAPPETKKKGRGDKFTNNSPRLAAIEPRKASGRSSLGTRSETQIPYPISPAEAYGNNGALMHGYYPPPAVRPSSSSSGPNSRNASSQSLRQQQQSAPPAQFQYPYMQGGRYYAVPEASRMRRPSSSSSRASSRPDPTDPSWEPRNRSSSNVLPYPLEPPQYQAYHGQPVPQYYDPRDPRFAPPGRRVASGPPDVYPGQLPAGYYRYPQPDMFTASGSAPNLAGPRRTSLPMGSSSSEVSNSTDEDEDEGVQVQVVEKPAGGYDVQTRSSTSTSKGKGAAKSKRGKGKR
ncbi:putative copii vesicles protein [Phaeomoniella chlamydospora]|uniref:Putative copii vesicles protein n=1 Tax=Phaeomoniella chlamydospora TaxID=158046 RepID=A0A0G2EWL5_PHACM|nr:putative copii vesicles protein [Phaeomoniella chlamydospora]